MALKTFNIDEGVYAEYSKHCKANGISMSKQIEKFIANELTKLAVPKHNERPAQPLVRRNPSFSKYC